MSERQLVINDETWGFSAGTTGIGIRNPRDGKRYNVSLHDFLITVSLGPPYFSDHDQPAVTPAMVREYIEIQFLKTRALPDFRIYYKDYGVCYVYANKNLSYKEVVRRVSEEKYWETSPMMDDDQRLIGRTNPMPASHAPTTHVMYFFEYTYNLSDNYKHDVTAGDNVVISKIDNTESQETN